MTRLETIEEEQRLLETQVRVLVERFCLKHKIGAEVVVKTTKTYRYRNESKTDRYMNGILSEVSTIKLFD